MMSILDAIKKIKLPPQVEVLEGYTRTWMMLNTYLPKLSEEQVLQLMKVEQVRDTGPRKHILVRLHQRYSALRSQREKSELGIAKERPKKKA